jgi:hypothetical protein
MIRDLAAREGVSQNELLEQAAEHEVIARGALLADDLESAAAQLRRISAQTYAALVEASVVSAAANEGVLDPLRARKTSRVADLTGFAAQRTPSNFDSTNSIPTTEIGAVAAFENLV